MNGDSNEDSLKEVSVRFEQFTLRSLTDTLVSSTRLIFRTSLQFISSSRSQMPADTQGTLWQKSQKKSYDPQQDMQEKRVVRQGYRALIQESENAQGNIADVTTDQLTDLIRRGDDLNKRVKAPTEGVLDSRFLLNMSDLGQRKAKSMKLDTASFDIEDYMMSLARFIGGGLRPVGGHTNSSSQEEDELEGGNTERWNWDKLGRAAARYSRRVPTIDFLLGPLEIQHKQRKVTQRKKFERPEPEAQAQRLQQEDIQRSENETTKLVAKIYQKLESIGGEDGINLFKFAINPQSFSDTVENLFYISFLVRDGKVSIDDNQEGIPMLNAVDQPSKDDYDQGLASIQLIVEFEMQTWRDLIEAFDIKESIIPTRKVADAGPMQAGKWDDKKEAPAIIEEISKVELLAGEAQVNLLTSAENVEMNL